MKVIKKIDKAINMFLGYISFIAFFVIMAFIVINVFMRFVFNSPVLGAYEIVEQMMLVGVFCSFAYAQQEGAHIRVTMFLMHMPKRVAMFLCFICGILGLAALCLLTKGALNQFLIAYKNVYTSAMLKFVLWPFYLVEIICSAAFALAVLVDTIEYFLAIFKKDLAEELCAKF